MTASSTASSNRLRGALPWLVVIGGLVLVGVVGRAGSGSDEGRAFDPSSTSPTGARALVLLLESFGAEVTVSTDVPSSDSASDDDVVLVLVDVLSTDQEEALSAWAEGGGTVVVADPFSPLTAVVSDTSLGAPLGSVQLGQGECDIDALADVRTVDVTEPLLYDVAPDQTSCFGEDGSAFAVVTPVGEGRIVSVGSPWPFTNADLDEADNAALATSLLLPSEGAHVTVMPPVVVDAEGQVVDDRSLSDVLPTGARLAFLQLFLAFVAYSWYRARRVGAPVIEEQPVEIAGSELVVAVGHLMQQQRDPNRAASLLRADTRRVLAERFGLPAGSEPHVIADVVAHRSAIPQDRLAHALTDLPVADDHALLELARSLDEIRKETLHGT